MLTLPEPPADDVTEVLDDLRLAHRELADAERIVRMLSLPYPGTPPRIGVRRLAIEISTAEHRRGLWAAEVEALTDRARTLGLRP